MTYVCLNYNLHFSKEMESHAHVRNWKILNNSNLILLFQADQHVDLNACVFLISVTGMKKYQTVLTYLEIRIFDARLSG